MPKIAKDVCHNNDWCYRNADVCINVKGGREPHATYLMCYRCARTFINNLIAMLHNVDRVTIEYLREEEE